MSGKYDDIINMPHHVSRTHKPMSADSRAAQFAPFAALTGYDVAIARVTHINEIEHDDMVAQCDDDKDVD